MNPLKFSNSQKEIYIQTLNLEATEENLYDDLEDSSASKGKRADTKGLSHRRGSLPQAREEEDCYRTGSCLCSQEARQGEVVLQVVPQCLLCC